MGERKHCERSLWGCHVPNACTCICALCRPHSRTLHEALLEISATLTGTAAGRELPVDNPVYCDLWRAARDARAIANALAAAAGRFESIELVKTPGGAIDFAPAPDDGSEFPRCGRCNQALDFVGELRAWRCANAECPRCVAGRRRTTVVIAPRARQRAWPWQGRGRR